MTEFGKRSAAEMADLLGLGVRHVFQMAKDGVLPPLKGGKMDMKQGVRAYLKRIREENRLLTKTEAGRANLEAKTRMLKLQFAERCRELIPMDDSLQIVTELVAHFVLGLDSLPSRLTRDPGERQRIVEICDGLRRDLAAQASAKMAALEKGAG